MTCIIGHRDGWMVADRRASFDGWLGPYAIDKIARGQHACHALVGVSGAGGVMGLVYEALGRAAFDTDVLGELVRLQREREDKGKDKSTLLLLTREGMWEVDPSGCPYPLTQELWAIGSVSMVALGYLRGLQKGGVEKLLPEHAEDAVRFAGTISTTVGDGTQVELL